ATIDVKDMFFMVPLQETGRDQFAFTWEGVQFTFTCLLQGYYHSPTVAHYALAQELTQITPKEGIKVYQYIDEILIGGSDATEVGQTQSEIIDNLENLGLQIPTENVQLPSSGLKFLGIWWRGRIICIPPKTLTNLEQVKIPGTKGNKDLRNPL
ncbi:hypothetical protein N322_02582, partial [Cariama cristata]